MFWLGVCRDEEGPDGLHKVLEVHLEIFIVFLCKHGHNFTNLCLNQLQGTGLLVTVCFQEFVVDGEEGVEVCHPGLEVLFGKMIGKLLGGEAHEGLAD